MSLDIWPAIDSGGPQLVALDHGVNITHNVHLQVAATGVNPWEWHGRNVGETIPELERALEFTAVQENRDKLRRLDAPNGFGRLEDSERFLVNLLNIARNHPKAVWQVSR